VTFVPAFFLDLAAALLALLLAVTAARLPDRARWLLIAAVGALGVRAGSDVALAGLGWIFAERRLLVDLPLAAIPVLVTLVLVIGGRSSAWANWVAVGACALATLDPLLLPGAFVLAALIVLTLAGSWLAGPAVGAPAGLLRRGVGVVAGLAVVALVLPAGPGWWQSRLPGRYELADYARMDTGGGTQHPGHTDAVPVTALTGPAGTPDVRVNLTAAPLEVQRDGHRLEAVAFNGTIPGPPIRATVGDLLQVHVCNHGDRDGVSVHWHGYDVPNAEDGVAGVTQNAIGDGGCFDYRFRASRPGSYWYHAHQASSSQVDRGLYGDLVVTEPGTALIPGTGSTSAGDLTVLDHAWRPPGGFLAGATWQPADNTERRVLSARTAVRLRLVNTDRLPHRYRLIGVGYRLVAVDGTDVPGASTLGSDQALLLAAGGRYDLSFTMPATGVRLTGLGDQVSVSLAASASGSVPAATSDGSTRDLDLLHYGTATVGPGADLEGTPDRSFSIVMDQRIGFAAGRVGYEWAVNGETYPRMPMLMVAQGDVVRIRLVNRTTADHPMHLHGHHVLVLSRNGVPSTGAPWWSDTVNVAPGEDYVVAFRADNPGLWMDHCHDLRHAAAGFVMHLGYLGVSTPYRIGDDTANEPE
jgi:FtsP/CotA-like multicopper oxidase with cupredoxin domain